MATIVAGWALIGAAHAEAGAQAAPPDSATPRVTQSDARGRVRDQRSWARPDARQDSRAAAECAREWQDYARRQDEFGQWMRKQHIDWHRQHDGERDSWVRQHQALHSKLDRTREEWARRHRPPACRK